MIRQLFKLMWNSKRNHSLLIGEIFVSFLVLFAVFSMLFYQHQNYVRPMGFESDQVLAVWFENVNAEQGSLDKQRENILDRIKAFEEVENVTVSRNSIPFSASTFSTGIIHEGTNAHTEVLSGDENYSAVFDISMKEGRWFDKQDEVLKYTPVIINQYLKEELFGELPAIGKILTNDENDKAAEKSKKVIGIIGNFKYKGDFQAPKNIMIEPVKSYTGAMLIKAKGIINAELEAKLSKAISAIAKGYQVEIERLSDKRATMNNIVYIPGIILLTVCGFLILNVILGLFGILWQNINKRKGEIGTRRAMGATQALITQQFIGEVVIIATFGLILGSFFAIQFPLMDMFGVVASIYYKAMLVSILLIYFLVIICAFYPSWQASKIHPAIALHAD